jgi:hypothetical protein
VLPFLYLACALLSWHCLDAPAAGGVSARRTGWGAAAAGLLVAGAGISSVGGFAGFEATMRLIGPERSISIVSMEGEAAYLDHWSRMGQWLARRAAPGE